MAAISFDEVYTPGMCLVNARSVVVITFLELKLFFFVFIVNFFILNSCVTIGY